jgi:hypothetical protein
MLGCVAGKLEGRRCVKGEVPGKLGGRRSVLGGRRSQESGSNVLGEGYIGKEFLGFPGHTTKPSLLLQPSGGPCLDCL